jgi:hypothetical protein
MPKDRAASPCTSAVILGSEAEKLGAIGPSTSGACATEREWEWEWNTDDESGMDNVQ